MSLRPERFPFSMNSTSGHFECSSEDGFRFGFHVSEVRIYETVTPSRLILLVG